MYMDITPRTEQFKHVLCPFPFADDGWTKQSYQFNAEAADGHDVEYIPSELFRELEQHIPHPSTGMAFLWWYHRTFGINTADIYGFDFFNGGRHHYYDDDDARCHHDGNAEKLMVEKMMRGEL